MLARFNAASRNSTAGYGLWTLRRLTAAARGLTAATAADRPTAKLMQLQLYVKGWRMKSWKRRNCANLRRRCRLKRNREKIENVLRLRRRCWKPEDRRNGCVIHNPSSFLYTAHINLSPMHCFCYFRRLACHTSNVQVANLMHSGTLEKYSPVPSPPASLQVIRSVTFIMTGTPSCSLS